MPGPTFSCVDGMANHLRIGIANDTDEVVNGLQLLALAWNDVSLSERSRG